MAEKQRKILTAGLGGGLDVVNASLLYFALRQAGYVRTKKKTRKGAAFSGGENAVFEKKKKCCPKLIYAPLLDCFWIILKKCTDAIFLETVQGLGWDWLL
jgi:hypothetical protein